jgi:GTPase SAR1 family protein
MVGGSNELTSLYCILLGVSGSGKSNFVRNCVVNNDIQVGDVDKVSRTTNQIVGYKYKNITLFDTPGVFDNLTHNDKLIKSHIETIFRKIKKIDYILLCIPATKHGVREVDILTKKTLNRYKSLQGRIFVYISKTDLLGREQLNTYIRAYQSCTLFQSCKTFMGAYGVYQSIYSISASPVGKDIIFNFMEYKNPKTTEEMIEDDIMLPFINSIQNYLLNHNLYPVNYKVNDTNSWLTKKFFNTIIIENTQILDPTTDIKVILTLYNSGGNVASKMIKNKDIIRYANGNIFYDGTLHGNIFDIGKFYHEDGELMYDKKC